MLIDIAAIPFLMVDGKGNPNEEDGDYSKAMQLLYGITFTIKMSRKGTKALEAITIMWCRRWRDCGK